MREKIGTGGRIEGRRFECLQYGIDQLSFTFVYNHDEQLAKLELPQAQQVH